MDNQIESAIAELRTAIVQLQYAIAGQLDVIAAAILLLYCKDLHDDQSLKLRHRLLDLISGMKPSFFYTEEED